MSLGELAIKRPVFITCVVAVMVVVGLVSFKRLPVDQFPDVSFPVVAVSTPYRGAGPEEIETLVTKPMEEELSTISGLKRISSTSQEGASLVVAEFRSSVDIKYADQQVRDKVAAARPKLPEDIDEPVIMKFDPADQPIITISLRANLPSSALYDLADREVKRPLEQVSGVSMVRIFGGRKREIKVSLDRDKLKARELSLVSVAGQIAATGQNTPGGSIKEGGTEQTLRTLGEYRTLDDIANTVIGFPANERATRVRDVGGVFDTLEDEKNRVFVNGVSGMFIRVYRQSGSNTVAVAEEVGRQVARINQKLATVKGGANLDMLIDSSIDIKNNVKDVYETIILGIFLTVLVVYFFLANGRSTFITGLALPNSLIGGFILIHYAGFTINVVSLMALSLVVGLLIDDAIVVRENIFRHLENGAKPMDAAIKGTREVQLAVVASSLAVIAVFGPVGMMQGVVGQFLKEFGLTICFVMAISLFDSLTIAPMLSAYFVGNIHPTDEEKRSLWGRTVGRLLAVFDRFQDRLTVRYVGVIGFVTRRPLVVIIAATAFFISSLMLLAKIPVNFNPDFDQGKFNVDLKMQPGTSLAGMSDTAMKVDEMLRAHKEVKLTALVVGGWNSEPDEARIFVELVPRDRRPFPTARMQEIVREELKQFAYAEPKVTRFDPVASGQEAAFMMNLIGNDEEELEAYATALYGKLKQDPRFLDTSISLRAGKPELQVRMKEGMEGAYGVTAGMVGTELRGQLDGAKAGTYREHGEEYDIRVRLMERQRNLKDHFNSTYVPNLNGRLVRLADVADKQERSGPSKITRQDRARSVLITADIPQKVGVGAAMAYVEELMKDGELKRPAGIRFEYIGSSENFAETAESMGMAIAFAVLFIYLVMASLYESFITPFTIMLALPLAICGAFYALWLSGQPLNILGMLGLVMLLGVAGKNSILLVDYANRLVREGHSRVEAITEAGRVRLRPILMTSMALIAGMIPVAIGLNEASKFRTSMGIIIIGGMITSTFLTLLVVPAAYSYIDRFRVWTLEKARRRFGVSEEGAGER